MMEQNVADQLYTKFIAPPERHSKIDLACFLTLGGVHLVCGIFMLGERAESLVPDPDAVVRLLRGLWWAPFGAGLGWLAVPFLLCAGKTPMPRLLTLSLQLAGLCSGFVAFAIAISYDAAG